VPDSGMSAATGYSEASGLPMEMGLLKNAYSRRTFIQPSQGMRDLGVMMKLTPVRSVIRGKRLIVIDDSIVRGTTSLKIVRMLRKAGASEVHMRITSPMITSPCFYGVDISSRSELLCADRDLEKARQAIEADSLAFISQEGLLRASGRRSLCFACFDRDYPTKLYSHQI
ncbi:MAG: amidophosphoribosyltransferase, partial [Candidatus Cryptobacteroides sp.]|nr:amidophosphoribosyltransferase [Candidatus Cryptobacteroides sp.]